jgi:hypothetical protein
VIYSLLKEFNAGGQIGIADFLTGAIKVGQWRNGII